MDEKRTLRKLAAQAYAANKTNMNEAVRWALNELRKSAATVQAFECDPVLEDAVTIGLRHVILEFRGDRRDDIKAAAEIRHRDCEVRPHILQAAGELTARFLMKWQMDNGRFLAQITLAELEQYAAKESAVAAGHLKTHRFYKSILRKARSAGADKTSRVKDVISDSEAEELWNKANERETVAV